MNQRNFTANQRERIRNASNSHRPNDSQQSCTLNNNQQRGKTSMESNMNQIEKNNNEYLAATAIASRTPYSALSIKKLALGVTVGMLMTLSTSSMALTITNPGFETGDLTGWVSSGTGGNAFATMSYTGKGPTYTAPWNDWFGVVLAGSCTRSIANTFSAKAGETILGWSFFQANEWDYGGYYNDTGLVKLDIVTPAGVPTTLFFSSVAAVGSNSGFTPWIPWEYTFPTDGVYKITAEATNVSDCSYSSAVGIDMAEPGGFVTGGGWINSPAGAYKPDLSLTGKANYGFVSKYKKGATVPTGNTEFQFQTGDLNFHSDSYEWLVVNKSGTNAQFKGDGTINGNAGYRFMIWATDNDNSPDTFRIKIWETSTQVVVYDNGVDTALGGGNNVIRLK